MNIAAQRWAVGIALLATTMAMTTAVLSNSAEAGTVGAVTPAYGQNSNASLAVTFGTATLFPQRSRVEIVRVGGALAKGDHQVAYTTDTLPTKTPHAVFNLQDGGDGENDGPANPGVYSVFITQGPYDEFGVTSANPDPETDQCLSCFSVLASTSLSLASISPAAMAIGDEANVKFNGSGFARGTRIDVLLPDGSVDPNVTTNEAPYDSYPDPADPDDQRACAANADAAPCNVEFDDRTTSLQMVRRVHVYPGALAGSRAVRVANTDGNNVICSSCFSIGGQPLQGVSPSAASNDAAAFTHIDFFGTDLPPNTKPQLAYVASTTGSSTGPALSLEGTNVTYSPTKVSADFDVRDAAPGTDAYQPRLLAADGRTNSCVCRFSVVQTQPASVTSVAPASGRQGETLTVDVNGARLSRGVRLDFGAGISVVSVEHVSSTVARAQLTIAPTAPVGARTVTPQTTDGKPGNGCGAACFAVTQGASPSPSASPTPTPTTSPSASPAPCTPGPARVIVNTPTINATGYASVSVRNVRPNSEVELQGYSQNHEGTMSFANDPTPVDRAAHADPNGNVTFSDLRPGTNTRLRARQKGCEYGGSAVIEVRTQLSLQVQRTGRRAYTFSGQAIPARTGGLIVSLYRIVGSPCAAGDSSSACSGERLIGQVRANALSGQYAIPVRFAAQDQGVRDEFVVKTGRDNQNAPGRSNGRSLLIS